MQVKVENDIEAVRVTPLLCNGLSTAACSLLEIGNISILLDCGYSPLESPQLLSERIQTLVTSRGRHLDAVLISHADLLHLGSLPVVIGKSSFAETRLICTLPIYKFGQMVLYDYFLNREMEGISQNTESPSEISNNALAYDLDDVDRCMSRVTTVKFSQSIQILSVDGQQAVTLTAHPSGRTVGGSMWSISYGSTDIMYAVDINLKKEVVLDGVSFEQLPQSPALLIADAGGSSSISNAANSGGNTQATKKKKEAQSFAAGVNALITMILETVRGDGNVLLPCETGGRALELIQQLGSYWAQNNLGMYHLAFVSPMAHNVMEFSQSQLEWMSDSLSRSFYNGKHNPFDLPFLKVFSSVREMEKQCVGPKVVISTDSSLNCGHSKELLLKWGGDPRCRVIFTDASDPTTLANQLRTQAPPIFVTVTKPVRVELTGEELAAFRAERAEKERVAQEESMKRKRAVELELLAEAGRENYDDTDEETEDDELLMSSHASSADSAAVTVPTQRIASRQGSGEIADKRRRLQASLISKFVQPRFVMFESKAVDLVVDEFGASIDDLKFQDVTSSQILRPTRDRYSNSLKRSLSAQKSSASSSNDGENVSNSVANDIPSKLVATTMKVQITCGIREINLSGRIEAKGIRTFITRMSPTRVLVIGGSSSDCSQLVNQIRASNTLIEAVSPTVGATVTFPLAGDRLKMQVFPERLGSETAVVRGTTNTSSTASGSSSGLQSDGLVCTLVPLSGTVMDVFESNSASYGTRLVRLHDARQSSEIEAVCIQDIDRESVFTEVGINQDACKTTPTTQFVDNHVGDECLIIPTSDELSSICATVSVGEVMLSTIKSKLEQRGVSVEFRLGGIGGGTLICGSQILIRKSSDNDFVLEGPPIALYYEVRRIVYEHFAFI